MITNELPPASGGTNELTPASVGTNELTPASVGTNELTPALAGGPQIIILKGFSQKFCNYHSINSLQNLG